MYRSEARVLGCSTTSYHPTRSPNASPMACGGCAKFRTSPDFARPKGKTHCRTARNPGVPNYVEDASEEFQGPETSSSEGKGEDVATDSELTLASVKRQKSEVPAVGDDEPTVVVAPKRKHRSKASLSKANKLLTTATTNARKLTQPPVTTSPSVSVKDEPGLDIKQSELYHLGPVMESYEALPYLVNFATNIEAYRSHAMVVDALPMPELMLSFIKETVASNARSRANRSRLSLPSETTKTVQPVELTSDILSEPVDITQAPKFNKALTRVSNLWTQSSAMAVHQRVLESWTLTIIYGTVGPRPGDKLSPTQRNTVKASTMALMPILRPSKSVGQSDTIILRTQYYWTLLAALREHGAASIVAYRPSSVDAILLLDIKSRLKAEHIPKWAPTVQAVERHLTTWFDVLEGGKATREQMELTGLVRVSCRWRSPQEQSKWNRHSQHLGTGFSPLIPGSTLYINAFGYGSFQWRRKSWSIMLAPDTQQSIAIADIPEACFLGIVPGVLRYSAGDDGRIRGPCGVSLDTSEAKGSLAHISLGSPEETNAILAWHFTGDSNARLWKTCWLLAFSCRPIGIFQPLIRWNQILPSPQNGRSTTD